jgi:hypothetical protein
MFIVLLRPQVAPFSPSRRLSLLIPLRGGITTDHSLSVSDHSLDDFRSGLLDYKLVTRSERNHSIGPLFYRLD